jgi:hypothetical protein
MRRTRAVAGLIAVAVSIALVAGACGDDDSGVETGGTDGPFVYPTGADEIVVRVSSGGGYVPLDVQLADMPEYSLYGDGRLVFLGPQIEIFPPPALPPLLEVQLSDREIQALLQRAADAGLLGEDVDYGSPDVTDLGSTSVTINVDGTEHASGAYALGFDDENLTVEQRVARERLQDFIGDVDAATAESNVPPYGADAVSVFVLKHGPTAGDEDLDQPAIDWPFADLGQAPKLDGASGTRCLTLTAADSAQALELAAGANTLTPWVSNGVEHYVVWRPLLPDETGCDELT